MAYLDRLEQLKTLHRGLEHEAEMVGCLSHCTFGLNPRAASIDTPLHAFIPHARVDHVHPDAVIAIACTRRSHELTAEIFSGEIGWLAWQRPGFDLGLKGAASARARQLLDDGAPEPRGQNGRVARYPAALHASGAVPGGLHAGHRFQTGVAQARVRGAELERVLFVSQ